MIPVYEDISIDEGSREEDNSMHEEMSDDEQVLNDRTLGGRIAEVLSDNSMSGRIRCLRDRVFLEDGEEETAEEGAYLWNSRC